ncbi:MAG: hypothetical protein ABIS28_15335 [Caldimonas sp.]
MIQFPSNAGDAHAMERYALRPSCFDRIITAKGFAHADAAERENER